MPLLTKKPSESRSEFIIRCMQDHLMIDEFPEQEQRYAVCVAQWEKE